MSYPNSPVWVQGSWIFDKNAPIAVDGVPVAQPNFTDSPTVIWVLDPLTEKVTANLAGVTGLTFVYSGSVDPTVTAGLLTGTLYINTSSGVVFQLQVVGSANAWVSIGSIAPGSAPVQSVFGRTGNIASQFGDYSFSEISGTISSGQLPTLIPFQISNQNVSFTPSTFQTLYRITTGSGIITVTLPSAVGVTGQVLQFKKADSGSGSVLINGPMDGFTSFSLIQQYQFIGLVSNGSTWDINTRN